MAVSAVCNCTCARSQEFICEALSSSQNSKSRWETALLGHFFEEIIKRLSDFNFYERKGFAENTVNKYFYIFFFKINIDRGNYFRKWSEFWKYR